MVGAPNFVITSSPPGMHPSHGQAWGSQEPFEFWCVESASRDAGKVLEVHRGMLIVHSRVYRDKCQRMDTAKNEASFVHCTNFQLIKVAQGHGGGIASISVPSNASSNL